MLYTLDLCPPDVSDWHLTVIKHWSFEVCVQPEIELNLELAFTSFLVQKLYIKQYCASVEICAFCLPFVANDGHSPPSIQWSETGYMLKCFKHAFDLLTNEDMCGYHYIPLLSFLNRVQF